MELKYKKIYFLLGEMTHLRYFVPLAREYNRRKISSCFLIYFSGKYNCPSQHNNELDKVCKKYNIEKTLVNNFKEKNKIIFCVEKSCSKAVEQLGIKKQKGNRHTMSVSQLRRIWGKNLALEPNPFPQKGGEKVLITLYKKKN